MSDRVQGSRGHSRAGRMRGPGHAGRLRGLKHVGRLRGLWRAALATGGLLGLGAAGWLVSDRLEADNDFCTSCHITLEPRPGVRTPAANADGSVSEALVRPLHEALRRDFDARPPVNLAGSHGAAGGVGAGRESGGFRCIDCHGGVGLVGRARVKALALKDAVVYLSGDFEEPDGMHWPLQDADCRQCHERFDALGAAASTRFHELPVHNVELGVACVTCHEAHDAGDPQGFFLDAQVVRVECARCHDEYAAAGPTTGSRSFDVVRRGMLAVPLESRP